jgi:ABC-type polysaccharide/polyol phosphate transport system ATPase subunit
MMSTLNEPIIEVENLTIRYRTGGAISYRKLISQIFHLARSTTAKDNLFTALDSVSFSVYAGETVGIIGENGSGKSTLLRAIAGIYTPDQGRVEVKANGVSLLALGVGFQSRLTGYQNIFLSGYAMGISKKDIQKKLDEIIEFSEIGDFIHKSVQTYSSGMYSKLAFSISCILSTSVVLIDEVLSVGDIRFQKKSEKKIADMIADENRSVLIVSHANETLRNICDKILWLHRGKVMMFDKSADVIDAYIEFMKN